jgi:hypothetical protein
MWTPEIIRARFVEAADTERRLPKGGGGSSVGYWPSYEYTFEDKAGWGTKRLAEEREMRLLRIPPSSAAITRHAEVMVWTSSLIDDERKRKIVWAWAWCRLSGASFAARCKKHGWVRLTAYRRLSATIDQILGQLRNDATLLRLPDEKWVLQETPDMPSITGTMGLGDEQPLPVSPTSLILAGDRPGHTLTSPQAVENFEKHLARVNRARRKEQERRRKLGIEETAA